MKKNKAFSLVELSVVILIIGILIAGITQSGRLIRQMKLSTARSVTSASDVSSIRDITAWFETSSENIFVTTTDITDIEDQDSIKKWTDINPQKSKSERPELAVGAAGTEPKYYSNGINGVPAIYFDGGDKISMDLGVSDPASATFPLTLKDKNFSMFTVFRADAGKVNTKSILTQISGSTIATNTYASLGFWNNVSGPAMPGFISDDSRGNNFLVNKTISDQTDYILGAVVELPAVDATAPTRDNVKVFLNSTDAITTSSALTQITGGTLSNVLVGDRKFSIGSATDGTDGFTGLIGEVIIFDRALKKEEYESVIKYLQKKYNIRG